MRIFSKFHDYYDAVQNTGFDNTVKYMRTESEEHKVKIHDSQWTLPHIDSSLTTLEMGRYFIGFCGKIYQMLKLTHESKFKCPRPTAFCYSVDDVDKFIQANFKRRSVESYFEKHRKNDWRWVGGDRNAMVEFFAAKVMPYPKFFEKGPIFVASSHHYSRYFNNYEFEMKYNTCLKPIEFYRVVDPFTAYQELQMYLANIAVPQKPMPIVPDILKAETHGFNKFSFRKDKQGG